MRYLLIVLLAGCALDTGIPSPEPRIATETPSEGVLRPVSGPPLSAPIAAPSGLTPLDPEALEVAVAILREELAFLGLPGEWPEWTVWHAPVAYMTESKASAEPVYGIAQFRYRRVLIPPGDVCDRPEELGGRLVGNILSHEMAHAAGYLAHDAVMYEITTGCWIRWAEHCGLDLDPVFEPERAARYTP